MKNGRKTRKTWKKESKRRKKAETRRIGKHNSKGYGKEMQFGKRGFNKLAKQITMEYLAKARKRETNPRTGKPFTRKEAKYIGKASAADIYRGKLARTEAK